MFEMNREGIIPERKTDNKSEPQVIKYMLATSMLFIYMLIYLQKDKTSLFFQNRMVLLTSAWVLSLGNVDAVEFDRISGRTCV